MSSPKSNCGPSKTAIAGPWCPCSGLGPCHGGPQRATTTSPRPRLRLVPPARTAAPHHVAGIGFVSGACNQPVVREQGRKPAAHHRAVHWHGDFLKMAQPLGFAQIRPGKCTHHLRPFTAPPPVGTWFCRRQEKARRKSGFRASIIRRFVENGRGCAGPALIGRHPTRVAARSAAVAGFLDRRAGDRAIGTENTTIARFGLQNGGAGAAFVKPLAGIRRHHFLGCVAAFRAGDRGLQDHGFFLRRQIAYPVNKRNPAKAV